MPDPAASAAMSREADRSSLDDADRWLSAEMAAEMAEMAAEVAALKEKARESGEGYGHMEFILPGAEYCTGFAAVVVRRLLQQAT